MRCLTIWCMVMAGAALGETNGSAQAPLLLEILQLRMELHRQGVEFQDWKIRHIENELQQAGAEARRLSEEERALIDELNAPEGEPGESGSRKEEITGSELPRLRELRSAQEQRVSQLSGWLAREQQRRQALEQLAAEAEQRKEAAR